jgi:SAM-dependent methyltransferase
MPCGFRCHRAFLQRTRGVVGACFAPRRRRVYRVTIRRLNWGCGPAPAPGWINADRLSAPGLDVCGDISDGLALEEASIDYAVAMHGLQDVPYLDLVPALRELRRVLRVDGVLRVGVPDLARSIDAWQRGDRSYFYIRDDEVASIGGKLIVQAIWFGSTRTPFMWDFFQELAAKAGFRHVRRCTFRQTESPWPEIVELDNRERESLFAEAVK